MKSFDILEVIALASKCGVTELKIDTIEIKFQNSNQMSKIEVATPSDSPIVPKLVGPEDEIENSIEEEPEVDAEELDELDEKLQELDLMTLEDPHTMEDLLAKDPELLEQFERRVEELPEE